MLEVGPGQTLTGLIRARTAGGDEPVLVPSMGRPGGCGAETANVLNALGRLWLSGVTIDWRGFWANERRNRVPLPTYPFQRERYWAEGEAPSPVISVPSGLGDPSGLSAGRGEGAPGETARGRKPAVGPTTPRTPVEAAVAEVWQDVLGVAEAGLDDDFFESGGNSLTVTEMVARLNRQVPGRSVRPEPARIPHDRRPGNVRHGGLRVGWGQAIFGGRG